MRAADAVEEVKGTEERVMWKLIFTALWLGMLAGMDVRRKNVPVWLLTLGGIFMTLSSVYEGWKGRPEISELFWSVLPGVALLVLAVLTKKAGWADGAVLLLLGIYTGSRICIISFGLSMFFISIVSLALLAFRNVNKNTKLPFLPFLYAGYMFQAAIGIIP